MSEATWIEAARNELAVLGPTARARAQEESDLHSEDPWVRADVVRRRWLDSFDNAGTRDQYEMAFAGWATYCVMAGISPLEATTRDAEVFSVGLRMHGNPAARRPRPLGNASRAQRLAAVSSFYRRARREGVVERNPLEDVDRPSVSKDSPQPYLSPGELGHLFALADRDGATTAALVALLARGLRVSEAVGADVEDLREMAGHRLLRVQRKGGAIVDVTLPPALWARVEAAVGDRTSGPLLLHDGERMHRLVAYRIVRRLGHLLRVRKDIGPHTLRHAYITRAFEIGIPQRDIQLDVGHKYADTTGRYDRRHLNPDNSPAYKVFSDIVAQALDDEDEALGGYAA
jgi:integrase/recombinase XerD